MCCLHQHSQLFSFPGCTCRPAPQHICRPVLTGLLWWILLGTVSSWVRSCSPLPDLKATNTCSLPFYYQVVQCIKNPSANAGDVRDSVRSLGWEDPLEEGVTTHSSILTCRIPWTEEPGGLQSMGSEGVGHDLAHHAQYTSLWNQLPLPSGRQGLWGKSCSRRTSFISLLAAFIFWQGARSHCRHFYNCHKPSFTFIWPVRL